MASVKLKYRTPSVPGKEGTLYFQLIHGRVMQQVKTNYRIYASEWDKKTGSIAPVSSVSDRRTETLKLITDKVTWEMNRLNSIIGEYEQSGLPYQVGDIISRYKEICINKISVAEYMRKQIEHFKKLGKERTGETYQATLNSFMKFRKNADLYFDLLDAEMIELYEAFMRANHLSRNTTSFYMRILRCVYHKAVNEGLTLPANPFKNVYTGVDKTSKRAVTLQDIRQIKKLDLRGNKTQDFARDIFLFSFYMRGMSFIDIAYLRKKDLCNGYVTYNRRKTGQQLVIRWEKQMQEIIDKYGESDTQYLLPIIEQEDGTERRQYQNKMLLVNRKLKKVAARIGLATPLTMYVARHSWASIARSKDISVSIISEAMGHDSENTTKIYLSSIQTEMIDEANRSILKGL